VKRHGINPFIFGPLKKDFEVFSKTILEVKPKYIIGFANISTKSHIESLTVNKFGKKGRILSDGADSYALYLPKRSQFAVSNKPTNSFCNWTMYKIAELIEKEKLKTKLIFVHVTI